MLRFWNDRRGVVALYVAFLSTLVLGTGAIAVDVGRMVTLKTQMQNAADSAALSAAAQLDGRPGAIARAQQVAQTILQQRTGLATGTGSLNVQSVNVYSQLTPTRVPTANDKDALYVEVTMASQDIALLLKPVLDALTGTGSDSLARLGASAVATPTPIVCNASPLMMCDLTEALGPSADVLLPSNVGRQLAIRRGPNQALPGDRLLLCTPDGLCDGSAIRNALAAVKTGQCQSTQVAIASGQKTGPVRDGIDALFDLGTVNPKNPARNVIAYPRDSDLTSPGAILGNGSWDPASYWSAKHGGEPLPLALTGTTRYQTYLYELGERFARNGTLTMYPLPADLADLPAGFQVVQPPGEDIPVAADPNNADDPDFDGVPQSTPAQDPKRRVLTVAVVRCLAQGAAASVTVNTMGRYIEIFITEDFAEKLGDAEVGKKVIFAELVGPLIQKTGTGPVDPNASDDFHVNVRLVE